MSIICNPSSFIVRAVWTVVCAAALSVVAQAAPQSVAGWGSTVFSNTEDLSSLTQVAAGENHTVALESDGTVTCWGSNQYGQCNVPPGLGAVAQVAAGSMHTVVLKPDGTVACWGSNSQGQCSVPANVGPVSQVAAGGSHTVALRADGSVACWGYNWYGQCNVPSGLGQVQQVAAGSFHTVAIRGDGTVACWGSNSQYQCNVPAGLDAVAQVAAGKEHTVVLKPDGTVACWGSNSQGQCNVPSGLGQVQQVAAGSFHTVALKSDGTVACWGSNSQDQCNVPVGLGAVAQVARGGSHTVALKSDGTVACWGSNSQGQCSVPANVGPVSQVAAGGSHTVALRADGSVACWGYNWYGQCNVPSGLGQVQQVAVGDSHTVALMADGTVACWGWNQYGQCNVPPGLGAVAQVAASRSHTVALKSNGTVVCWGTNSYGQCNVPSGLGQVQQVAAGGTYPSPEYNEGAHTVALTADGTVVCWGWNLYGQCDVPPGLGAVAQVAAGGSHTVALKADGFVACWGRNNYSQCNVPANLGTVCQIAAAGSNTVVLTGFPLEIRDPNYAFSPLRGASGITTNVNLLGNPAHGKTRTGFAADGVTPLILRRQVSGPGMVTFSLFDEGRGSSGVGALRTVSGDEEAVDLAVPAVLLADGRYMAFAILTAPKDFVRGAQDESAGSRPMRITATFAPASGAPASSATQWFNIVRPPVVLMHGLWSDAPTWGWPIESDSRFHVLAYDYSASAGFDFWSNRTKMPNAVIEVLREMQANGIAATQADVVAHSMGGILARLYISNRWTGVSYGRISNFFKGDIHKLITLDTPHMGSALAAKLVNSDGSRTWLGAIAEHSFIFGCVDCGAVADLRMIDGISQTEVRCHAIVGTGGSDLLDTAALALASPGLAGVYGAFSLGGQTQALWQSQVQHDLVVSRASQEGGLPAGNVTSVGFSSPTLGIHVTVTHENAVGQIALNLLNTPIDQPAFADFFPAIEGSVAGGDDLPTTLPIGLSIISPGPGQTAAAGGTVQVVVEPLPGFNPVKVLIGGPGNAILVESPPFAASVDVPAELLGSASIWAVGIDRSGALFAAEPVGVSAETDAKLVSIDVNPDTCYFNAIVSSCQLSVAGTFSDEVVRDATAPAMGTAYFSEDDSIATVDENGVVRSVAIGSTVVHATNGALSSVSTVTVLNLPLVGDLNGDEDVGGTDLGMLLGSWGPCDGCAADLDGDGVVDGTDLGILLGSWGTGP